jgi:hypothetical protein
MTKKDYELIAEALAQAYDKHVNSPQYFGVKTCINNVTEFLGRENPKFNRNKFLKACGLTVAD